MIIAVTYTPLNLKIKTAETRQMLYENIKQFIRSQFDQQLVTSLEAEALIAIAKELGLNDMAIEMISDLETELTDV